MYGQLTWNIPDEKNEGYIEDLSSGYVLGINKNNGNIELEEKNKPIDDRQIWKRSEKDPAGWYEFSNKQETRKLLSAHIFLNQVYLKGKN